MFREIQRTPNEPDPRIAPLVEALTTTGEITILGSSEGHLARICDPYVYFSCAPEMAERLAARLDRIRHRLNYYWQLSGRFNQDCKLCFDLRSPELFHTEGSIRRLLRYGIFRKRIDHDLSVLQDLLCKTNQRVEPSVDVCPHQEASSDQEHDGSHPSAVASRASEVSNRVYRSAIGTRGLGIGSDGMPADATTRKFRQDTVLHDGGLVRIVRTITAGRKAITPLVVVLALTLSACGTPDVELQHETTGSDELLLSPCVGRDGSPCAPVPYRAPAFTWIGVG